MNEFIEKLIARLEKMSAWHQKYGDSSGYTFAGYEGAISIVKELAEEHKGGWIPCSERLPEDMQTVLFTSKDGYVDCGLYDADKNWCVNDNYFPNAFRFIAWQPLPEPYKSEEPQWKQAMMNTFLKR